MTEEQDGLAGYRERCNCFKCQEVKAAVDLLAESYKNMALNLIDQSGAENIGEKVDCIQQVVHHVMGPDLEKIGRIVIETETANIEFYSAFVGQVLVQPKINKTQIN